MIEINEIHLSSKIMLPYYLHLQHKAYAVGYACIFVKVNKGIKQLVVRTDYKRIFGGILNLVAKWQPLQAFQFATSNHIKLLCTETPMF